MTRVSIDILSRCKRPINAPDLEKTIAGAADKMNACHPTPMKQELKTIIEHKIIEHERSITVAGRRLPPLSVTSNQCLRPQ